MKFKKISKKQIIKIIMSVLSIVLVVAFLFGLTKFSSNIEQLRQYNSLKEYPEVTEEIVRDVIAKLNMKVKSQVIVDLVVGRYELISTTDIRKRDAK